MPAVGASPDCSVALVEVAAFDFDGTLTRRDTLLPYLWRGLGWPRFLVGLLLSGPWLAAFALRLMSNHRAKGALTWKLRNGRLILCATTCLHSGSRTCWRACASTSSSAIVVSL